MMVRRRDRSKARSNWLFSPGISSPGIKKVHLSPIWKKPSAESPL